MASFHWAVLIRRIRTGGTNIITETLEEGDDGRVFVELPALIEEDIFVTTSGRVVFKEVAEPMDGGALGDARVAVFHPSEVIGDENPTCFAIDAHVVTLPGVVILGFRAGKREVNGEPLIGLSSRTSGVGAGRLLSLFGTDAGRA